MIRFPLRISLPDLIFKRTAAVWKKGNTAVKIATAVFDPSANTGERTIAAHKLGVFIPNKAIITRAWVDVITTFTTASADAGTIALHVQTADDLVAAIAVSDATNVWDSGLHGTITAGTTTLTTGTPDTRTQIVHAADIVAGYIKMTAERELIATVAVQALTAGKLNLFVEYIVSA